MASSPSSCRRRHYQIIVLELKIPHGDDLAALRAQSSVFFGYVLSFIYTGIYWNNHSSPRFPPTRTLYTGIYWNNHHHMMKATDRISGGALWANLHLLFWLSLAPFVTGWMGENHFATVPVACFGFVVMMPGVAYYVLSRVLVARGQNPRLQEALGSDFKGKLSVALHVMALHVMAIPLAFVNRWLAVAIYILVALLWLVPDRRIENRRIEKKTP